MRAALERSRARTIPNAAPDSRILSLARAVLLGSLGALAAAAVFEGGGSSELSLVWIGSLALLLACGAIIAGIAGLLPIPRVSRLGAWSLALFGAFVLGQGASVLWSLAPDRSWDYFNRGLVYLAFAVAGVFAGAVCSRRHAASALALIIAGALLVALAGKVIPDLYPDGARIARLRSPVGFWNALGLLFAIGVPLALWAVGERRRPGYRALGAVFLYGLLVGLLLTYSRSGVLAAVLAAGVWLAFTSARLQSGAVTFIAALGAAVVGLWAFGQPGVAEDLQAHAARVRDGWQLGVMLVLGATAVWIATYWFLRSGRLRAQVRLPAVSRRQAIASAAVALALFTAATGVTTGWIADQADEFANPPTDLLAQDPGRLTSVSSNNRWDWWQEAWTGFREAPVRGTGAGSFETTHRLLRDNALVVTTPHSLPLQFLSETGLVGGLLAGGAALAGLLAAAGAVRRQQGTERAASLALAIGVAVFVVHSFVDWDWDFIALGAPVFAALGILFGERSAPGPKSMLWGAAAFVLLIAALASLTFPWLAERRTSAAYEFLAAGAPADAVDAANDAASLNPVSIEPLIAESLAHSALGDLEDARENLRAAVDLQPANPNAWLELGLFELDVSGDPAAAIDPLGRAYELDPYGPAEPVLERALEGAE